MNTRFFARKITSSLGTVGGQQVRPRRLSPQRLQPSAQGWQLARGMYESFKSGPLRGTSSGKPCISHHREEKGLVYRMVCRGPPAGQERRSYAEFKWEAAGLTRMSVRAGSVRPGGVRVARGEDGPKGRASNSV